MKSSDKSLLKDVKRLKELLRKYRSLQPDAEYYVDLVGKAGGSNFRLKLPSDLLYNELKKVVRFDRFPLKTGGILTGMLNAYRKRACPKETRMLLPGEKHLGCHNFTGPGTRIDLKEVRDAKPYNAIDACSKQHDLDYWEADKKLKGKELARAIRAADKRVLDCYDRNKNVSGYWAANKGIRAKNKIEDTLPEAIARKMLGALYGHA